MNSRTKNKLSFIAALALLVGNIVGSGVYLLPASLASLGAISLWGWVFSSFAAVLLALIFAILAKKIGGLGGSYIYVKKTLGNFMAFQTAYSYWLSILIGNAAIAVSFASYLKIYLKIFWSNLSNAKTECGLALAAIWFATFLNMLSIKNLGLVQIFLNFLKFVPLILVGVFGWWFVHPNFYSQSYNISAKSDFSAISSAAIMTFWAFTGIESATVAAGLVRNSKSTIPLATILAVVLVTLIYISCSAAIMGMINPQILQHSLSPFADAAQIIIGDYAKYFMALVAAISCFGSLHGWILLQGQFGLKMAEDGLLPSVFAKKNSAKIPTTNLVITSSIISFLIVITSYAELYRQFSGLILLATIATILSYFYTALAFAKLQSRTNKHKIAYLLIVVFVEAYLLWAFFSVDNYVLLSYALLMLLGTIFYFLELWR